MFTICSQPSTKVCLAILGTVTVIILGAVASIETLLFKILLKNTTAANTGNMKMFEQLHAIDDR